MSAQSMWAISQPGCGDVATQHSSSWRFAVCSNLRFAWPEMLATMPESFGQAPEAIFGASGRLSQQVLMGLPVDAFFSAAVMETAWLHRLHQAKGLEEASTPGAKREPVRYAVGALAVYRTSPGSSVLEPTDERIAIANPAVAPYGRAAAAALTQLGVDVLNSERVIHADSVAGVVRLVRQRLADAGWIATSMIQAGDRSATEALPPPLASVPVSTETASPRGVPSPLVVRVPDDLHPPIVQHAIYTGRNDRRRARMLNDWIASDGFRAVLRRFGFLA